MQVTVEKCPYCRHKLFEHYGGEYVLKRITAKDAIRKYGIKSKCPNCSEFIAIIRKSN